MAVVLWEVFSRLKLYPDMITMVIPLLVATQNRRPEPLPGTAATLNALITGSWAADPAQRPTAEKVQGTP
jgi:hypothetical protein